MRAFFGVALGEAARQAAAALARQLAAEPGARGVRFVRPEAYHLTLRFLGTLEPERAAPLADAVRAAVAPLGAFALRLGPLWALPSPRRARVVVLDVEPEAPLVELAAAVERACVARGCEPEPRRFRAHLTLGRVRGAPLRLGLPRAPEPAAFGVSEVVLFRSEPGPDGSVYTPLARCPLAPAGGGARPVPSGSSRSSASEGENHGTQL